MPVQTLTPHEQYRVQRSNRSWIPLILGFTFTSQLM